MGGLPVCPFIKRFERQIIIKQTENPHPQIQEFPELNTLYDIEAMVLWGFSWKDRDCDAWCDELNHRYNPLGMTILFMNPEYTESPLPVQYTWPDDALIIVQNTETLAKYEQQLRKNTKYYDYFREID